MKLYHGSNLEVREPQLIAAVCEKRGGTVNDDQYSAETLYALYDEECRSGKLTFPEEAC